MLAPAHPCPAAGRTTRSPAGDSRAHPCPVLIVESGQPADDRRAHSRRSARSRHQFSWRRWSRITCCSVAAEHLQGGQTVVAGGDLGLCGTVGWCGLATLWTSRCGRYQLRDRERGEDDAQRLAPGCSATDALAVPLFDRRCAALIMLAPGSCGSG